MLNFLNNSDSFLLSCSFKFWRPNPPPPSFFFFFFTKTFFSLSLVTSAVFLEFFLSLSLFLGLMSCPSRQRLSFLLSLVTSAVFLEFFFSLSLSLFVSWPHVAVLLDKDFLFFVSCHLSCLFGVFFLSLSLSLSLCFLASCSFPSGIFFSLYLAVCRGFFFLFVALSKSKVSICVFSVCLLASIAVCLDFYFVSLCLYFCFFSLCHLASGRCPPGFLPFVSGSSPSGFFSRCLSQPQVAIPLGFYILSLCLGLLSCLFFFVTLSQIAICLDFYSLSQVAVLLFFTLYHFASGSCPMFFIFISLPQIAVLLFVSLSQVAVPLSIFSLSLSCPFGFLLFVSGVYPFGFFLFVSDSCSSCFFFSLSLGLISCPFGVFFLFVSLPRVSVLLFLVSLPQISVCLGFYSLSLDLRYTSSCFFFILCIDVFSVFCFFTSGSCPSGFLLFVSLPQVAVPFFFLFVFLPVSYFSLFFIYLPHVAIHLKFSLIVSASDSCLFKVFFFFYLGSLMELSF
ncbi:unnamed protein product [Acanthosepion pharaonis]|uniref:Uncharacterized protein n=1 Tax=Acanthosepion pharaonis TaxID=158019 RepID=A0A812D341_ACAPH|nr:unnamed protein product [Sepia pharaonis]